MATKNAAKATTKKTATKTAPVKATVAAPAAKSAKAPDKVAGVTEMTREKHNYEGYAVRTQKDGNTFRRYVSASEKARPEKTEALRKKGAYAEAVELVNELRAVLDDKKSWDKEGKIRPSALKVAATLGFKHEIAKVRKPVSIS